MSSAETAFKTLAQPNLNPRYAIATSERTATTAAQLRKTRAVCATSPRVSNVVFSTWYRRFCYAHCRSSLSLLWHLLQIGSGLASHEPLLQISAAHCLGNRGNALKPPQELVDTR